jgi:hypothetical protein
MKIVLSLALASLTAVAMATGSLTETRTAITPPQRIQLEWTADTNGNVDVTTQPVRGRLGRVVIQHGTNPAPDNATYAVTLLDLNDVDLLDGQGSAVATNEVVQYRAGILIEDSAGVTNLYSGVLVNEALSLVITNLGINASGSVTIYAD